MSDKEQIKIISRANNSEINKLLKEIEVFEKKEQYYYAFYKLEKLILKDGTIEKLNDKFLNLILDHYEDIINQIKNSSDIKLDEFEEKLNEDALGDVKIYNFYYFRDCFDRYEVTLSQPKLEIILNKKKIHNNKIIEKYPSIKEEYLHLITQIENKEVPISADTIYEKIKYLNESIISDDDTKLFNIYEYLDVALIMNKKIFDLILKDRFYLNRYSFGHFDELGIPIGFSDNSILKYRYLFLLIKNKIIEIDTYNKNNKNQINKKLKKAKKEEEKIMEGKKEEVKKDKMEEDKAEKKEEDIKDKMEEDKEEKKEEDIKEKKDIEFVFTTFKDIFSKFEENKLYLFEYYKYFTLLFINVMFEGENSITNIYEDSTYVASSYFKILCEQFSLFNKNVDIWLKVLYEFTKKKKIEFIADQAAIEFKDKTIYLDLNDYSINSFLINLVNNRRKNDIIIKNNSKKLFCKDKMFGEYHDNFIELLKKICTSNTVEIMQSLHEEFKSFNLFYSEENIKDDLFKNRLKFYPFKYSKLYGITDKFLLEVYLSSIYFNNINNFSNELDENFEEILYIFNMGLNSVIFQHEALNHYVRAYLSYSNTEQIRKISINTKKDHRYYPIQKLDKITTMPKYLNKFLFELNDNELKELAGKSNLKYKEYLENEEKKNENKKNKNSKRGKKDDEGFYYERQLFTKKKEKQLNKFNFLQAIMLIDEDAYNLDPVHFHFCFLELRNSKKYKIIKNNFRSNLLSKLLGKIDLKFEANLKNLSFTLRRDSNNDTEMFFEFQREGYDVMSSYAKTKKK